MPKKNSALNIIILFLVLGIIFVLIGLVVIFFNKNNEDNIDFSLLGNENMMILLGDDYVEPGFIAKTNDELLDEKVFISGKVNTNERGVYPLTYTLFYGQRTYVLKRIVNVIYQDGIKLLGNNDMYILINGNYQEKGYLAYKNDQDVSDKVKIENNIDFNKEGVYEVKYTYDDLEAIRKVYISSFDNYFNVDYDKNSDLEDIKLKITIDESKIAKYYLPSSLEMHENSEYRITENGDYFFDIYDYYNNKKTVKISINNIKKELLTLSCNAIVSNNSTLVNVNSNKSIVKYYYNGLESNNTSYQFNKRVDNVKVQVITADNESRTINCSIKYNITDKLEIHFIASGHYDDAILIRTNDKTIFIDGGRYNCKDLVLKYLQDVGVKKIDALIGSHIQNDHIASQAAILDTYPVSMIYYPDNIKNCVSRQTCEEVDQKYIVNALNRHNITPTIVSAPKLIEIGKMKLYFIGPEKIGYNINNNSFIFILKFGNNTFMFTGDSDSPLNDVNTLTSQASKLGIGLDIDMLKYPHHGNKTLKLNFLQATTPKYVIVPNYKAPQYPNATNLATLSNVSASVYRQSDGNNILLTSDGTKITVTTNVLATDYKR